GHDAGLTVRLVQRVRVADGRLVPDVDVFTVYEPCGSLDSARLELGAIGKPGYLSRTVGHPANAPVPSTASVRLRIACSVRCTRLSRHRMGGSLPGSPAAGRRV